jgi:hypothetical protein
LARAGAVAAGLFVLFYLGYLAVQVPARILRDSSEAAAALEKVAQAEQRERDALGQSDPIARRQLLGEANQLAFQAAAQRPGSGAAATALARIQSEYQAATGTTRLAAPTKAVSLPTNGDQMLLADTDLFILDRSNSRVYSYLLDVDSTSAAPTTNPVLVRNSDHVGPATVGDLSQITWIPAGGSRKASDLLVLDTAGFLLQYEPTQGLGLLSLRDPAGWVDASNVRGYDGNLYALYPKQGHLTVYAPEPSGYDGRADDYFPPGTSVDLSDVETFSIDRDLFLVHASGRIERFIDGKPMPFAGPPDDVAPRHPVGIATSETSIFVGDPARARIIQVSRTGAFERVLSADDPSVLANLRDLALSADGTALFVLSGQTVFRYLVPA